MAVAVQTDLHGRLCQRERSVGEERRDKRSFELRVIDSTHPLELPIVCLSIEGRNIFQRVRTLRLYVHIERFVDKQR